ncbi:hypothetical protein E1292_19655 [Nonomuraea deserti]|uniref:Uncharacterized protein n=1 Tax=Nonomuraea deserti TaxID=1848322 RepID=A0A4R4VF51_9ACTN|nr:hypothetical protein [Nonomuraea deserti]TDD04178.1 hypothetical protein E1292_19655 [Nonomuraea deserti]
MFEFPVDTASLFTERSRRFAGWGIPEPVAPGGRCSTPRSPCRLCHRLGGDEESAGRLERARRSPAPLLA